MDDEGKRHYVIKEIVGHRKNGDAVAREDGFSIGKYGNKHAKWTTRGWKIAVELKDGSQIWIPLKEAKKGYPVELAEYAVAQVTLNHMRRLVKKVKKKYWKTTHKYGIRLPHSVEEALRIDQKTGTTFWKDAIKKELRVSRSHGKRGTILRSRTYARGES